MSQANNRPETIDPKLAEYIDRRIEETLSRRGSSPDSSPSQKATLVVFSGDMDKVMAAFIIASGAAAMGMDVTMFFTFWGLNSIRRGKRYKGKSVIGKMMAMMLPSGPDTLGTSKMNMLGMGPAFFKLAMKQRNVATLPQLIETARESGVRMVVCQMSLDVMGIQREELLDGLEYGGVATYIGEASQSSITLFI